MVGGGSFDGIVTLNSSEPFQFDRTGGIAAGKFDARRFLEHEMDEVLGFGSYLNLNGTDVRPQDLFSWSSPGTRNLTSGGSRYFSINGGNTNIVGFNQTASLDFGDWLSPACPQSPALVQYASSCAGSAADVTQTSPEGVSLDVIGYDPAAPLVALQFPDGSIGAWYLGVNGRQLSITAFNFLAGASSGIELVDVADLNGDGVQDLILHFTDGSSGVWYMGGTHGTTITGFAPISGPIAGWRPAAIADLNNDGHPDLLIQNRDGSIGVWFLGGAAGNQIQGFGPISGPTGWRLVGSADLNDDGHLDAIIQNTDGSVGVWYLVGAAGNQIEGFGLIAGTSAWSVTGVSDIDGDGHPDLMIRNPDGTLGVWYLGGAGGNQITDFTPITGPGNTDWHELGAH